MMTLRTQWSSAAIDVAPHQDELLIRYMRALLRTGSLAEKPVPREDLRTCARCGAFARFEPLEEAGTWTACSSCGGLA